MSTERLIVEGHDSQGHLVRVSRDIERRDPGTPVFTHGEQITMELIGARGTFTDVDGFTTSTDGVVYRNLRIHGGVTIRHHTVFDNCVFLGSPGASGSSYTVKHIAGSGKKLELRNSTVVTRTGTTKGVVMYGNGGLFAQRTLFKGGTDNLFVKPKGSHFEGVACVVRECMFGWLVQTDGGHSDCIQVDGDGGGITGGALFDRVRAEAFYVPAGADPLTANWDPTRLAGTAIIMTGSSPIANVRVRDSKMSGGNYTAQLEGAAGSGPIELTGCRFGTAHRYGPTRVRAGATVSGNTWAEDGTTACCGRVRRGDPIAA